LKNFKRKGKGIIKFQGERKKSKTGRSNGQGKQ